MILSVGRALFLALIGASPPQAPVQDDRAPIVRRIAASAELAAQEYRTGVRDGRVTAPAEVDEARLFLSEARRTADLLPLDVSRSTATELDGLILLVSETASPDTIDARVRQLTALLASKLGVSLDEIPTQVPTLARGAAVYQRNCASCHGLTGRGDGPAGKGLDPVPANLTDFGTLTDRSPLDYYHRITIGVAGTAMPAFETSLSAEDRWAAAVYATVLRLPAPKGAVPLALREFATTARMSDAELGRAIDSTAPLGSPETRSWIAAVRSLPATAPAADETGATFARVRDQLDSAFALVQQGRSEAASTTAFDAYMTFEGVERGVRAKNPGLASALETAFASFRTRAAGGATTAELETIRQQLAADLENAERVIGDQLSPLNLFVQSLVILLREGLEAILVIGALVAFLLKTGAGHRRREIHVGIGAAIAASLLTAVVLETLLEVTPARQEALEGVTMMVATAMLFYVSYWLLSKMEVAKWNRFVRGRVQDAVSSGSALALASVAFLAVYREGFETVLFYKALFVTGGSSVLPVVAGMAVGSVVLVLVYLAINRFGVKIPLKPFFGITSAFLYYMAFVFAGKGVAELQEGGLVSTTILRGAPRFPALGIYPTVESLALQAALLIMLIAGLVWTFAIEPRRLKVTAIMVPDEPRPPVAVPLEGARADLDMLRSLDRMDADLAELRAEVDRLKRLLTARASNAPPR